MTYGEYIIENPENLDLSIGYTEYLVTKFKSMSDYLTSEIPNLETKLNFEGKNSELLENIAALMEEFLYYVENR